LIPRREREETERKEERKGRREGGAHHSSQFHNLHPGKYLVWIFLHVCPLVKAHYK
jgi:hypothetical protein